MPSPSASATTCAVAKLLSPPLLTTRTDNRPLYGAL
jgi:hypothetical protein